MHGEVKVSAIGSYYNHANGDNVTVYTDSAEVTGDGGMSVEDEGGGFVRVTAYCCAGLAGVFFL